MIKFFRVIRRRLLSENKFTQYFLYATGEVLLVVLGILIALQINNWNEWQKDRVTETLILKSLFEEFQNNQKGVQEVQLRYLSRFQKIDSMMLIIGQNRSGELGVESIRNIRQLFTHYTWNPEMSTIEGILSSGQIEVLQNKELKKMILNWTSLIDDYQQDDATIVDITSQWVPFLSENVPLYDVFSDPQTLGEQRRLDRRKSDHRIDEDQLRALLADHSFFNMLGQRRWWMDIKIIDIKGIEQYIGKVLELIQSEIHL